MQKNCSDAPWYCRRDPEEERFYDLFFSICQKYHVNWASATDTEKEFVEEVTRVTYERERAVRLGLSMSSIRPTFAD